MGSGGFAGDGIIVGTFLVSLALRIADGTGGVPVGLFVGESLAFGFDSGRDGVEDSPGRQ